MSAGKGSARRPLLIPEAEMEDRWSGIFGPKKKTIDEVAIESRNMDEQHEEEDYSND